MADGTVALVATHWEPVELPAFFTSKEPRLVGALTHGDSEDGHDMVAAAQVLADLPEVPAAMITHRLPLDQVLEGIGVVSRGEGIKVTIEP